MIQIKKINEYSVTVISLLGDFFLELSSQAATSLIINHFVVYLNLVGCIC